MAASDRFPPVISNPLRILQTLDRHLTAPFTLYVYGRSALALGYANAPADFHATMDVDAILPARDVRALEADDNFWLAQEKVNRELGDTGLYFTHLFEDRQVILTPDWLEQTVSMDGFGFARLVLRRPSTADLILTKMMRVDPQDREDIRFLLQQPDLAPGRLDCALSEARVPDVPEISEAYRINRAWLQTIRS